jgi:single-stranded-DNA-specific exonuclease
MILRVVRRHGGGAAHGSGAAASLDAASLGSGLHPVLRRVYVSRGVRSPNELASGLDRLIPVGTLEGVTAAAELLIQHRNRRVLIIGDFDADGATSTALAVRALRAWGFASVDFLVPNRFEFGYGLTPEIVAFAAQRQPTLLVTVDNGISSVAGVADARAHGMDVLITDHHLPGAELPAANVIVNPNLNASRFGSRALAGVGVAFYVMVAVRKLLDEAGATPPGSPGPAEFLDLVALGTVADVVPLDLNNRVLVAQGLRRIQKGRCAAGIRALLQVSGRADDELTAADLAFGVAPRLNAAGRLDDMTIGIQCLLADDPASATELAARLDQLNEERRAIEARMQAEALAAMGLLREPMATIKRNGVCLYHESWHQGVVGLVASRVKDRVRRPVIAFARGSETILRGSARSIPGIHVRDVLDAVAAHHPGLITKFGGHAMAAGLTIDLANLDRFAHAFDAEVARWLTDALATDAIETDGELTSDEIALETARALRTGGPWGQSFPEPCFDGVFAIRNARLISDRHLKMWIEHPRSRRTFDAIAFNYTTPEAAAELPTGTAQLVYRLDINEFQGEHRLQLLVDHVLPAPSC